MIDTLRQDYPYLLDHAPNTRIYTKEITFRDASGNAVHGLQSYETVFWLLRTQARIFLTSHSVQITSLYHDECLGEIAVRWRVTVVPRGWGFGGDRGIVVDGLSVYKLNREGLVREHCLEGNVRRRGVKQVFENVLALGHVSVDGVGVGVGVGAGGWYSVVSGVYRRCEFAGVEDGEVDEKIVSVLWE